MRDRTEKVKELRDKYEEYSQLADIEEEKVRPLLNQLEKAVGKGKVYERVVSFVINIVAGILLFVLSVWASPKVQKWIDGAKINNNKSPIIVDSLRIR